MHPTEAEEERSYWGSSRRTDRACSFGADTVEKGVTAAEPEVLLRCAAGYSEVIQKLARGSPEQQQYPNNTKNAAGTNDAPAAF